MPWPTTGPQSCAVKYPVGSLWGCQFKQDMTSGESEGNYLLMKAVRAKRREKLLTSACIQATRHPLITHSPVSIYHGCFRINRTNYLVLVTLYNYVQSCHL